MNYIERIKEITGIDITEKTREREVVFARSIYYKILRDTTLLSFKEIGSTTNQKHSTVLLSIERITPDAMKSKPHRALYYELLGKKDPDILLETENNIEVSKELLRSILNDCSFWLKPNTKRQLEKLV